MTRRIIPPGELEERLMDKLTEVLPGMTTKIFLSKQKLMMFAAAVGYFKNKKEKIEKKGEGIRFDIFEKALDDGYINALAVSETGNLNILDPTSHDARATIFEEYAHAGLLEIEKACFEQVGDPLDNLLKLIEEARMQSAEKINGIDEAVLKRLMDSI